MIVQLSLCCKHSEQSTTLRVGFSLPHKCTTHISEVGLVGQLGPLISALSLCGKNKGEHQLSHAAASAKRITARSQRKGMCLACSVGGRGPCDCTRRYKHDERERLMYLKRLRDSDVIRPCTSTGCFNCWRLKWITLNKGAAIFFFFNQQFSCLQLQKKALSLQPCSSTGKSITRTTPNMSCL